MATNRLISNAGSEVVNNNGGIVVKGTAVEGGYFVTESIEITSTGEAGKIPTYACIEGALCYCTEDSKFYQYDGQNWVEAKLGGAGLETGEGENSIQLTEAGSQAISEASAALGSESFAGIKGFYWTAVTKEPYGSDSTKSLFKFKLACGPAGSATETRPWPNESLANYFSLEYPYTVHGGSKYDKQFTIHTVRTGSIEEYPDWDIQCIASSEINLTNEYKSGMGFSDNAVFCPDKPQNGVVDFGLGAISGGEKSKAINYGATAFGRKNEAYGQYATAVGRENKVGYAGFAAGRNNTVSGESAAALNQGNTASGNWSFAGGYKSQATGENALAFGNTAKATGPRTIALGYHAEATEDGAVAIGAQAEASAVYSTAIGYSVLASGKAAHAEGFDTEATEEGAHSEGKATHAKGVAAHAEGELTSTEHSWAHVEGYQTRSSADGAHAEGNGSTAGYFAHAEGQESEASGAYSHAQNYKTEASGAHSHAQNFETTAAGQYSSATGNKTTAAGTGSSVQGYSSVKATENTTLKAGGFQNTNADWALSEWNKARLGVRNGTYVDNADGEAETNAEIFAYASGEYSHVEGLNSFASGKAAHAEGSRTLASGKRAHSEGTDTTASGHNSHAEGQDSSATGSVAHAEGFMTTASGAHSHAQGVRTRAEGTTSHAEGYETVAKKTNSHAEGEGTIANSKNQHVQGRLNVEDTADKYAHIIGGGTAVYYTQDEANADKALAKTENRLQKIFADQINESASTRANIHTVDWDGNAWYKGRIAARSLTWQPYSTVLVNKKGWYRVYTQNNCGTVLLNLSTGYSDYRSQVLSFIITLGYYNSITQTEDVNIKQLNNTAHDGEVIKKIRVVRTGANNYYIDIYFAKTPIATQGETVYVNGLGRGTFQAPILVEESSNGSSNLSEGALSQTLDVVRASSSGYILTSADTAPKATQAALVNVTNYKSSTLITWNSSTKTLTFS